MTTDTDIRLIAIDHIALATAYNQAMRSCPAEWSGALTKARVYLLKVAFVEFDESAAMRVESRSEPGRFYWVGPQGCSCRANHNHPCWPRAARQLVTRMLEVQERQQTTTKAQRHAAYTAALADVNELFSA